MRSVAEGSNGAHQSEHIFTVGLRLLSNEHHSKMWIRPEYLWAEGAPSWNMCVLQEHSWYSELVELTLQSSSVQQNAFATCSSLSGPLTGLPVVTSLVCHAEPAE